MHISRRQRVPLWLEELIQEMMRPPYFWQYLQEQQKKASEADSSAYTEDASGDTRPRPDRPANGPRHAELNRDRALAAPPRPRVGPAETSPHHRDTAGQSDRSPRLAAATATRAASAGPSIAPFRVPSAVLRHYDWKIDRTESFDHVLRVHTPNGSYAVKRTHISPERVRFIHKALQYSKRQGFRRYAPFVFTKKKRPFVVLDGNTYYATEWVQGNQVNFAISDHVAQTAYSLAQLHEHTRGFEPPGYCPESAFELLRMQRERHHDLRQLLLRAEHKKQQDEFDKLFFSLKDRLLEDSEQCLQLLAQRDCEAFLTDDATRPGLCHLDVIPGNFILDGEHQVQIIDFDLSTFGPRSLDIAHLLRRSLQQTNWRSDLAYTCFLNYNAVKTMPKVEYAIIQALLRFPYRAWRVAHTRYHFFSDAGQLHDLKGFRDQEPRRQNFLQEFSRQVEHLS